MYGRDADLKRLDEDRNNPQLSRLIRRRANTAHRKIVEQMKDKKLMKFRQQLIKASQLGDLKAQDKITKRIREYTGESRETGL